MLMSIEEVKKNIGVSTVTIYKLMNEGIFPKSVKVGRKTFWRRADVAAYVESL